MPRNIDIEKVKRFLKEKEDRRRKALQKRWAAACNDFNRIVSHIISTYRPLRVYQWGSLLHPEHFSEISDIDIALEGLSGPEEYFAILGDVMSMSSFPLDIIDLGKVEVETATFIKQRGKLIYEGES
jgi:predicted nucleotidyltransferase